MPKYMSYDVARVAAAQVNACGAVVLAPSGGHGRVGAAGGGGTVVKPHVADPLPPLLLLATTRHQ